MKHQVLVVAEAEEDIIDVYRYVLRADGRDRADYVLRKLQETCRSLALMPRRGPAHLNSSTSACAAIGKSISDHTGLSIRSSEGGYSFTVFWTEGGLCRRSWNVVCSNSEAETRIQDGRTWRQRFGHSRFGLPRSARNDMFEIRFDFRILCFGFAAAGLAAAT